MLANDYMFDSKSEMLAILAAGLKRTELDAAALSLWTSKLLLEFIINGVENPRVFEIIRTRQLFTRSKISTAVATGALGSGTAGPVLRGGVVA